MPTISWNNLPFNPKPPRKMHVDMNASYASAEQQADPFLRGKPIAVAAYNSPRGCVIAPSIEAKQFGIKVGMRVGEAQQLCRNLVVLEPDAEKYRYVHRQYKKLLSDYTDALIPKSIDEFQLDLENCPLPEKSMRVCGREIKQRVRDEIGDWLRVNIGVGPNYWLAKTAAGLHKPDGLDAIFAANYEAIYRNLQLMKLCGIKAANCVRLNHHSVFNVLDFFHARRRTLEAAFESINGYYWYLRLRGWEADDVVFDRHSYCNEVALGQELKTMDELAPVLMTLVNKTGARMRKGGYRCRGVHVAVLYKNGAHWHQGVKLKKGLVDSREIYGIAFRLLHKSPYSGEAVRSLSETVYELEPLHLQQYSLFGEDEEMLRLVSALDGINERWGDSAIVPALMLGAKGLVQDRISFSSARDMLERDTLKT